MPGVDGRKALMLTGWRQQVAPKRWSPREIPERGSDDAMSTSSLVMCKVWFELRVKF
jgi:hypothetical protein